jgi:hypothetical protein
MSIEWNETPESEPVEAIGYDEPNEEVWVRFRSGSTYAYSNVPAGVFEQFRTSDSSTRIAASSDTANLTT